jgi:multidrug transporter EmrE-like cation transporter
VNRYLLLIFFGVFLNAIGQLCLKQGMRCIGPFEFELANVFPICYKVTFNPYVLGGISSYILSVVIWLIVLSKVEVSYAYPFLSIGYIIVALAGKYFFDEGVSSMRWLGILVICVGVYLITRSE